MASSHPGSWERRRGSRRGWTSAMSWREHCASRGARCGQRPAAGQILHGRVSMHPRTREDGPEGRRMQPVCAGKVHGTGRARIPGTSTVSLSLSTPMLHFGGPLRRFSSTDSCSVPESVRDLANHFLRGGGPLVGESIILLDRGECAMTLAERSEESSRK